MPTTLQLYLFRIHVRLIHRPKVYGLIRSKETEHIKTKYNFHIIKGALSVVYYFLMAVINLRTHRLLFIIYTL